MLVRGSGRSMKKNEQLECFFLLWKMQHCFILCFIHLAFGLTGYYSNNVTTDEAVLLKTLKDNTPGFPLEYLNGFGALPPFNLRDYFYSIIWRGNITATVLGDYKLDTIVDDWLYITIDGNLILKNEVYNTPTTSSPFSLDESNHTIEMKYFQTVYYNWFRIVPNSTSCCSLDGGLTAQVFYYDPFPFFEYIQSDNYLSWRIDEFPPFMAAKWKGIISTPPFLLGKTVTFETIRGMRVTFNDQVLFDSYYYDKPSMSCPFEATLQDNQYNVTIEFQKLYLLNYDSIHLLWGLSNDLYPFPTDPYLIVENTTVFDKDTHLGNLLLQKGAILQFTRNLFIFNTSSISGQLIVNGNLTVPHITIFLPNDLQATTPLIQANLFSNQTSSTTLLIKNTLPIADTPFQIISFNSSTTQFTFQFPDEYHDSTWDCQGNGYEYSYMVGLNGVFIMKSSSSGCGIGVKVVGGVVGSVVGVVVIASFWVIYNHKKDFEDKLRRFTDHLRPEN